MCINLTQSIHRIRGHSTLVVLTLCWQHTIFRQSHWKLVKKVSCVEGVMNGGYTDTRNFRWRDTRTKICSHNYLLPVRSFIHSFVTHSIPPKQEHMPPLYIPSQTNFSLICLLLSVILLLSHTLQFIYIAPSCPCAHHEGTWGEQTSNSTHSSPAWVVSTTRCRFTSSIQRQPVATKQLGGWTPESVWVLWRRQISCLCRKLNRDTSVIHPVFTGVTNRLLHLLRVGGDVNCLLYGSTRAT
jgi:hypothetical protein